MNSVLLAVSRQQQRRREDVAQTRWFVLFNEYATGTRPIDWRKVRSMPLYDLVIRDDVAFIGGKKLKLEGTSDASRLFAFAAVPSRNVMEVCVCFRASTSTHGAVGGCFIAATVDDDGQNNEIGGRVRWNGVNWSLECWNYVRNNGTGLSDFSSPGSPNIETLIGYAPGDFVIERLRYDFDDKSAGARGTASWKIWKQGTAEPSAWQVQEQIPVGVVPGFVGIYTNDTACGAEYNWFSVAIDGASAPLPSDNVSAHKPTSLVAPLFPGGVALLNEDFAGIAAGTNPPTGWSPFYEAGATWTVTDDGAVSAGKRVRSTNNGHRSMIYPSSVGLATPDLEIIGRLRYGARTDYTGGLAVRMNGSNNNSAVCAHLDATGALQITFFKGGGFSQANPQSMGSTSPAANEWLIMQLRANGTRFKARYWREDELPPVAWHHNFVDATASIQNGGAGAYNYEAAALDIDWASIKAAA